MVFPLSASMRKVSVGYGGRLEVAAVRAFERYEVSLVSLEATSDR